MSKHEDGELILRLYELRRESKMRAARDWFFRDFHPKTVADYTAALFSEHSGHLRMVISYWDMAAALVNHGAIDRDLFNDTNGEQIGIFAKVEPLLDDLRGIYGQHYLASLEKLIDDTPNGRERVAGARQNMRDMQLKMEEMQSMAARS
jgi:hypothetical protein